MADNLLVEEEVWSIHVEATISAPVTTISVISCLSGWSPGKVNYLTVTPPPALPCASYAWNKTLGGKDGCPAGCGYSPAYTKKNPSSVKNGLGFCPVPRHTNILNPVTTSADDETAVVEGTAVKGAGDIEDPGQHVVGGAALYVTPAICTKSTPTAVIGSFVSVSSSLFEDNVVRTRGIGGGGGGAVHIRGEGVGDKEKVAVFDATNKAVTEFQCDACIFRRNRVETSDSRHARGCGLWYGIFKENDMFDLYGTTPYRAKTGGGAMYAQGADESSPEDDATGPTKIFLTRSTFSENKVTGGGSGGAIVLVGIEMKMVGVEFEENEAAGGIGGAVSVYGENSPSYYSSKVLVNNTVWKSNRAQAGGALAVTGVTVTFEASGPNTFLQNVASAECTYDCISHWWQSGFGLANKYKYHLNGGGAVFVDRWATARFYQSSRFVSNVAGTDDDSSGKHTGAGGAIFSRRGIVTLEDCWFEQNLASAAGGALMLQIKDDTIEIQRNVFKDNKYLFSNPGISKCPFSGNGTDCVENGVPSDPLVARNVTHAATPQNNGGLFPDIMGDDIFVARNALSQSNANAKLVLVQNDFRHTSSSHQGQSDRGGVRGVRTAKIAQCEDWLKGMAVSDRYCADRATCNAVTLSPRQVEQEDWRTIQAGSMHSPRFGVECGCRDGGAKFGRPLRNLQGDAFLDLAEVGCFDGRTVNRFPMAETRVGEENSRQDNGKNYAFNIMILHTGGNHLSGSVDVSLSIECGGYLSPIVTHGMSSTKIEKMFHGSPLHENPAELEPCQGDAPGKVSWLKHGHLYLPFDAYDKHHSRDLSVYPYNFSDQGTRFALDANVTQQAVLKLEAQKSSSFLTEGSHMAFLKIESTEDTDAQTLDVSGFPDYWPVKIPKSLYWRVVRTGLTSLPDVPSTFTISRCRPDLLVEEKDAATCAKGLDVVHFPLKKPLIFVSGEAFDVKLLANSFEGNALNQVDLSERFSISVDKVDLDPSVEKVSFPSFNRFKREYNTTSATSLYINSVQIHQAWGDFKVSVKVLVEGEKEALHVNGSPFFIHVDCNSARSAVHPTSNEGAGTCQCMPGSEEETKTRMCEACSDGTYKNTIGNTKCSRCDSHYAFSSSNQGAVSRDECFCQAGYYWGSNGTVVSQKDPTITPFTSAAEQCLDCCTPCPLGGRCMPPARQEEYRQSAAYVLQERGFYRLPWNQTVLVPCMNHRACRGQPLEEGSSLLVQLCEDAQWFCTPGEENCANTCVDYFTESAQANNSSEQEGDATEGCDEANGYLSLCHYDPDQFLEGADHPALLNVSNAYYYRCIQCAQCGVGWHLRGDGSGICDKCPENAAENVLRIAGMSLLAVLIVVLLVYSTLRGKGKLKQSDATKRILLSYLQLLAFAKAFKLKWPEPVDHMFSASEAVAEAHTSAISVDCAFTQKGASLNTQTALPVAIQKNILLACMFPTAIILVLLFWTVDFACISFSKKRKDVHRRPPEQLTTGVAGTPAGSKTSSSREAGDSNDLGSGPAATAMPLGDGELNKEDATASKAPQQSVKSSFQRNWTKARAQMSVMSLDHFTIVDKTVASLVTIVFLIYPSTVKESLKMLACQRMVHPEDENDHFDLYRAFLEVDHQLECYSPLHLRTLSFLTLPVTILITFGVPAVMAWVIHRSDGLMNSRRGRLRYMLLTTGYRPGFHWWESVTLCRKALIAAISVFYGSERDFEVQIFLGIGVCTVFLALHLYFAPYATLKKTHTVTKETTELSLTHNLETMSLVLSSCTLYLGQIFMLRFGNDETSGTIYTITTVVIMLSNIAFVVFATNQYFELKLHENPALEERCMKLRERCICCRGRGGRGTSPSTKVGVLPSPARVEVPGRKERAERSWRAEMDNAGQG